MQSKKSSQKNCIFANKSSLQSTSPFHYSHYPVPLLCDNMICSTHLHCVFYCGIKASGCWIQVCVSAWGFLCMTLLLCFTVLRKLQKANSPIWTVINWKNATEYKLGAHLSITIHNYIHQPEYVKINKFGQLITDLNATEINKDARIHSFGVDNKNKQINSVVLSPRANYTDWATVTCRRNLLQTFVDRGMSRGQRGGSLTVVNLSFLDQSRYFFFQVAPHLSS
jgi:hypothetical protein